MALLNASQSGPFLAASAKHQGVPCGRCAAAPAGILVPGEQPAKCPNWVPGGASAHGAKGLQDLGQRRGLQLC